MGLKKTTTRTDPKTPKPGLGSGEIKMFRTVLMVMVVFLIAAPIMGCGGRKGPTSPEEVLSIKVEYRQDTTNVVTVGHVFLAMWRNEGGFLGEKDLSLVGMEGSRRVFESGFITDGIPGEVFIRFHDHSENSRGRNAFPSGIVVAGLSARVDVYKGNQLFASAELNETHALRWGDRVLLRINSGGITIL